MSRRDDLGGLKLSVTVYCVIFALKIVVYFYSGVMALLAEALHTLSDIIISGFLLAAAAWSRKKPDDEHVFGHRRAENVAALVAATLFISFTAARLYEEAIPGLFHHVAHPYRNLPLVLWTLGLSMLIAAVPLVLMVRQKVRGAASRAQLLELVNDQLGLVAAFVGTLFIARGEYLADPIASIVVATIIAINAIGLLRENSSYLIGKSPEKAALSEIRRAARSVDGVLDVHDLRAELVGPDAILVILHVVVPRGLTVENGHRIAVEVQDRLKGLIGDGRAVVHVDPEKWAPRH
jgi:cation diffusion facilitator family transporter